MKFVENSTAKLNIFISWLLYSSSAPNPSVSITKRVRPSGALMAYAHSQSPLVHGLTEGPTPNPWLRLSMTRLSR